MTDAPIGIFDSGVGGLTVARAIRDQLPNESLLYVGDTAHSPYGPKPIAEVRQYSLEVLDFLVEHRFAHRIESRNAYVACDRGDDCDGATTLFLLCDSCGAAGEVSSTELHAVIGAVTGKVGFAPSTPVVEIRGLCAACRAKAAA